VPTIPMPLLVGEIGPSLAGIRVWIRRGSESRLSVSGWGIAAWLAAERVRYATSRYSWISPPSRSRRRTQSRSITSPTGCSRVAGSVPSGGRWSSARCGRCWLMPDVCEQDMIEVAAADDQDPVEALAAHAPDPALGVRSHLRRPDRNLDHADAVGAEDLVELRGELAVPVTDEKPPGGHPRPRASSAGCAPAGSPTARPGWS
jgi:hypothetical protein